MNYEILCQASDHQSFAVTATATCQVPWSTELVIRDYYCAGRTRSKDYQGTPMRVFCGVGMDCKHGLTGSSEYLGTWQTMRWIEKRTTGPRVIIVAQYSVIRTEVSHGPRKILECGFDLFVGNKIRTYSVWYQHVKNLSLAQGYSHPHHQSSSSSSSVIIMIAGRSLLIVTIIT